MNEPRPQTEDQEALLKLAEDYADTYRGRPALTTNQRLLVAMGDEINRLRQLCMTAGLNPGACEICLGKGARTASGVEYCPHG